MSAIDRRRSIGEVARELGLAQHTIRFWQTEFAQIKPKIGEGNRRYYHNKDINTLMKIQYFLHDEGYTIKGLRKLLEENKSLFKKDLENIKNTGNLGFNAKAVGKNLVVETICRLSGISKRLEDLIGKIKSEEDN